MNQEDARLVPIFKTIAQPNDAKTAKAGRPIFDDMEVCEIRFPGDRNRISVFPAHAFSQNQARPDGTTEPVTYAQRFPDQYKRFKQNKQQVQEGTPLEELPFLTQAKRSELKALSIHTAEVLADLDGEPLKTLGMGGRELKNQAIAYIQNASGSADVTAMAAEIEELKARLAAAEQAPRPKAAPKPKDEPEDIDGAGFEDMSDAQLKEFIKAKTGSAPRGNPSHDTLVSSAKELEAAE